MISLKDEIKKFENMIYNKELAEFVTVDQMFVGGGITIESMIHESNFIVEELKKMGAVFLNYCKLNEKVYNRIMEHQLSLHNQHSRINSIANSVDRKMGDMVKTLKELHENTVSQNAKSFQMLENFTEPLKKELEKKVDKITFQSQMKKFLEEYDQGGLERESQGETTGEERQAKVGEKERLVNLNPNASKNVLSEDQLPQAKKKGKVGFEDFYKFQTDVFARMTNSESKLQQASTTALESKQLILKYLPVINKNATETAQHDSEIYRLNNQVTTQRNQLETSLNKMALELNHKTSEQIWSIKLEGFYQKSIRPIISQFQQTIKANKLQLTLHKAEGLRRTDLLNEDLKGAKIKISELEINTKKISKQIVNTNSQIKANLEQFHKYQHSNQKHLQSIKVQVNVKLTALENQMKSQFSQLKKSIENLASTIGESVLKTVNKRIEAQLKVIDSQIKANRDKIKSLKSDVSALCDQIKNIKQLLAKKANYSDIIHHVEKKADREEFKDLQIRFHESSQQFVSKNLNESINQSKLEMNDKHRASSLTKASKTHFIPRTSPRKLHKTDFDTSTKLFMCGLEGHMGEGRSQHSQHARRKSMKSSAAAIASEFVE